MGDDRLLRRGLVIADIVDRAGPRPAIEASSTLAMSSRWMREKTWPPASTRRAVPARSASKALRPGPYIPARRKIWAGRRPS